MKFISEVSSNHLKNLSRIKRFIKVSKNIGCYAVKFQLFKVDKLFRPEIIRKYPNILERKKWELPIEFISQISKECKKNKIKFGCTPFYLDAVDLLKKEVDFFKISSYEILWDDLLKKCAKTKKKIIISTGMATLDEVQNAVKVLKKNGCKDLTILHCCSSYPTKIEDCNLSTIYTLRKKFKCNVGWSDHSVNQSVLIRAIEKWKVDTIEFHMDLDGKGSEFNQKHCWLPHDIKKIINYSNDRKIIDGENTKKPTKKETKERNWRADPIDGFRPIKNKKIIKMLKKY